MRIGILYNINSSDPTNIDDNESKDIVNKFIQILQPFFEVIPILATEESLKLLSINKVDFFFNICEGFNNDPSGESWVASTIELSKIPFSGSNSFTLALCLRKHLIKQILVQNNLRTPKFIYCRNLQDFLERNPINLIFPVIVKPAEQDASNGIDEESFVKTSKDLQKRVKKHFENFSTGVLVEEYIDGREINVSIIGNGKDQKALPLSEIIFDIPPETPKILTYDSKWNENSLIYQKTYGICPANVSADLKNELETIALRAYNLFNCKDYARVDFRIKDNIPYILEVNPNPGINSDSGLIRSATVFGYSYDKFVLFILETAFKRYSIPFILEKKQSCTIISETKDIIIQKVMFKDIRILHEWFNDKDLGKFMNDPDGRYSEEEIINMIFLENNNRFHGLVTTKDLNDPIGYASIYNFHGTSAEISYLIGNKKFQGKGFGSQIIENLCLIAKEKYLLQELTASVIKENVPSIKALERNGFNFIGSLKTESNIENYYLKKL